MISPAKKEFMAEYILRPMLGEVLLLPYACQLDGGFHKHIYWILLPAHLTHPYVWEI